tara:strand:- start:259 stop:1065 length:807 start_codon:yes stop_codon:yes gene_type:complete
MKRIELLKVPHDKKVGDKVAPLPANITEDTLFIEDGEIIGFYINDMAKYSKKACKLADIADNELRSKRVPKSEMSRGPQGNKADKLKREQEGKQLVTQYSVILGGVGPKPHMRRNYPTVSSVHSVPSARNFVKAMLLLAKESQEIMKLIMPKQYEIQKQLIEDNSPKKYRFCDLFTSSISNFNISADYHIDRANIKGCCNVIIAKRMSSTGGNTTVPDYDATFDSADNSMLVYPAWRNLHGVTPIETKDGGYRNTLVFYPLASFAKFK